MSDAYFSLIVWTIDTNMDYFKDMLESIDEQEYREFELYILDNNPSSIIETTIKEFFPDIVDKVHYRRLKKTSGGAYAYNIGTHFAEGDHVVIVGQHDRLSYKTLLFLNEKINELGENDSIIYTDHDELVGLDRMHPHFKSDFNKQLFLQTDYIGSFICVNTELYKKLGDFNEKAQYAYIYEYLLRACFKGKKIHHIPSLLYHKRAEKIPITKEERAKANYAAKEHMSLAISYIKGTGVECTGRIDPSYKRWFIDFDESSFRRFGGDYIYLKDENVRLYTRRNVKRMYSYLKQPDVAVVGIRFIGSGFRIDNVGYIYDKDGTVYPAFNGKRIFGETYENLGRMPRDVSMVDAGCCLIDAKVYRMLRGFDTKLTGRDAMLDFCIRAKTKGFRTVVVPQCIGKYRIKNNTTTEASHEYLTEKHAEILAIGDGLYNNNLPMGLDNYILPGMEE